MEQDAPSPLRTSHHRHPQPPMSLHRPLATYTRMTRAVPTCHPSDPLLLSSKQQNYHLSVSSKRTALPSYSTGVACGHLLTERATYQEGMRKHLIRLEQDLQPSKSTASGAVMLYLTTCKPTSTYLQCPPGDDLVDGNPTINFAVSLDWYWTLFSPPNWLMCAFALAFPIPFLFLLVVLFLLQLLLSLWSWTLKSPWLYI